MGRFVMVALALAMFAGQLSAQGLTDRASVHRGSVTIDGVHGRGIAVAIDAKPADGLIDNVVLLQAYGQIPAELPVVIGNARIVLRDDAVTVTDIDGRRSFVLELATRTPPASNREATVYTGFGLSHMPDGWDDTFDGVHAVLADPESGSLTRDACEAGGVGANACSIDCLGRLDQVMSCTTSCIAGFYACCRCRPWGTWEKPICSCEASTGGGGSGGGGTGSGDDSSCTNDGSGCAAGCMSCRPTI